MKKYRLARSIVSSIVSMCAVLCFGASANAQSAPPSNAQSSAPFPEAPLVRSEAEEINIAIGESKTISARDIRNYSEALAGVVDVKLTSDASQFVISGKRSGSTSLLLIRQNGTSTTISINVFARSPALVERELGQLLSAVPGLAFRRIGGRIFIDGYVANDAQLKRVQQVVALYPGQVESMASLGNEGAPIEQKHIVRIDFYFVQYDKSSTYAVGIGWPESIGGAAVIQSNLAFDLLSTAKSATATITNQPMPRLDIAARNGWAKVLKQATVITGNGVEATFENGGEQNYTVNTGLTIGIAKIQFGTDVKVLPRYNPITRELDVKLHADVSDLTPGLTAGALPGRNTARLETALTMRLGQSLVLSGIRTRNQSHTVSGIPGLSQIPILGLLFGSHSDLAVDAEGAIFIVPSIVTNVPARAGEFVDRAVSSFKSYHGDVDKVHSFDHAPSAESFVPPVAPASSSSPTVENALARQKR
ncbi:MAG: type II and III secretion system protein family protein [Polyangiales bacterium]